MHANGRKTAVMRRLIGYTPVSTEEQGIDPHLGCAAPCGGLVFEGIVEAKMLTARRACRAMNRLIWLVASIAAAAPDRTLQQIAAQLEAMRERTPRGGSSQSPPLLASAFHWSAKGRTETRKEDRQ